MAYHDVNGRRYWVDDRPLPMLGDPYRAAAELLARDVERYLYREHDVDGKASPTYRNPDFLAWAVARFDSCKTGSGHSVHNLDYDSDPGVIARPEPPKHEPKPDTAPTPEIKRHRRGD